MQRRTFIASVSATLALQTFRSLHLDAQTTYRFKSDPFKLGVASGDPTYDGVVLWTRLVPDPTAPDFGLPKTPIEVEWEVATDAAMKDIVRKGSVAAVPELNHSVHIEATGLSPAREYWYRFHSGGATSAIGHTKTAPSMETSTDHIRFAFASCQNYEWGYYVAHRDMARQDLDAVVFLGDYIYEHHPNNNKEDAPKPRLHSIGEVITLDQYRHHYAQYKSDPDLIACHQAHAWIVTPDDHEVENNWAGDHSEHFPNDQKAFLARRAAAYQSYYENMPLRSLCVPHGSHMQLYRSLPYGQLVNFTVLDTRQFRTPQPCGDKKEENCYERLNPAATMMGAEQEAWFAKTLSQSPSQWNIVANQVMIAQRAEPKKHGLLYPPDSWDGYPAARNRLTKFLESAKPRNPVFITGDVHQTWVGDIKTDFDKTGSPVVASELVGTSITSKGDGRPHIADYRDILAANPHLIYESDERGYLICDVDKKKMNSELRVAPKVSLQGGIVEKSATFVIESDRKGVHQTS